MVIVRHYFADNDPDTHGRLGRLLECRCNDERDTLENQETSASYCCPSRSLRVTTTCPICWERCETV